LAALYRQNRITQKEYKASIKGLKIDPNKFNPRLR